MAIITQNLNFGFDISAVGFAGITSFTETSTRFVLNYSDGSRDEFRGTGFTYDADTKLPTGGTVHAYSAFFGSTRLLNIEGLSIPARKVGAAAQTASLTDDFNLIKTALAGADSYAGGNKTDFFSGFAGNDTLNGRGGNDLLVGDTGNDKILGGAGADGLSGEAGADKLYGGLGNDTIVGVSGNDWLQGDAGADKLIGGPGIDTILGGASNDVFVLNAAVSLANRDVIKDFANVAGNNDMFHLENAVMPALGGGVHKLAANMFHAGAAAHDADDRIVYNRSTGNLFYDSNGNAAGGAVIIATLTNKPLLTVGDFQVI